VTGLLDRWDDVAARLVAAGRIAVLCDFDGTLAPIVDRPEDAQLLPRARRALEAISKSPKTCAGVLSGRSLEDVEARVGLPGLWYAGIHGLELKSPKGDVTRFYSPADVRRADVVRDELAQALSAVPRVHVEVKGPVLAVHYRGVDERLVAVIERAFLDVMERHRRELMIGRGALVLEARPRGALNKGTAVRMIRRALLPGTAIIYFGDDLTDRDAFRALQGVGISVEVAARPSGLADYVLPGPEDVAETLATIQSLVKEPRSSGRRGINRR
jgi:trehalose-phosphatase